MSRWLIPALGCRLHVDAASGGFVAPFAQPELEWDFRVPRVASINASGHKYGMAPLGVGWVAWRSPELLPEDLVFRVSYLGGDMPTLALNFSRPGGQLVARYFNFLRHGSEGYRKIYEIASQAGQALGRRIAQVGPFERVYDGKGALPAVSWKLKEPDKAGFTLYDLTDRLRTRGWQASAYPLPADRQDTVIQRVLVRHGIGDDKLELLGDDIEREVKRLQEAQGVRRRRRRPDSTIEAITSPSAKMESRSGSGIGTDRPAHRRRP